MTPSPLAGSPDPLFLSLQQALAGRYSLDRELGRGGMGIVYLAREVQLDRLVAIKLLPPLHAADARTRERFLAEARTAARLAHPHIIPIYAVDVVDDHVFYVMGFVDGESLAQRVAVRGPLPPRDGARLLREVAWALTHAHAQGIVHRDIKPDNILIERDSGRALLADFGIASAIGASTDGVIGTPAFMSPEQILGGELDARSDLYALGATAFYAFSGRVPFTGTDLEILARHIADDAPSLSSMGLPMPRYLVQVVAQCLAKARTDRPRDAQQVADLLDSGAASRRELPPLLRAFVKRDGRADGLGTVATVVAAAIVGMVAIPSYGAVGYLGVVYGALLVASALFVLMNARRLSRQGYTHADVVTAFDAEIESAREERLVTNRAWLGKLERACAALKRVTLGAALFSTVPLLSDSPADPDAIFPILAITYAGFYVSFFAWVLTALAGRGDEVFWRWLWKGRIGKWSFAIVRRVGIVASTPVPMTHRATELSLSLAAEQLYDALSPDMRRSLPNVPQVLSQLHGQAAALRQRAQRLDALLAASMSGEAVAAYHIEREQVAQQLEQAVTALERVRLDLLRLHAGVGTLEGVSTKVAEVEEIGRHLERHLHARREVEDIFADVQVSVPQMRADMPPVTHTAEV